MSLQKYRVKCTIDVDCEVSPESAVETVYRLPEAFGWGCVDNLQIISVEELEEEKG